MTRQGYSSPQFSPTADAESSYQRELIQAAEEAKVTARRAKEERQVAGARHWREGNEAARKQHQRARQQEQARRAEKRHQQRAWLQEQACEGKDTRMAERSTAFASCEVRRRREKVERERQREQEEERKMEERRVEPVKAQYQDPRIQDQKDP